MRLLSRLRRQPKRTEATTDDSQLSASTVRNGLKSRAAAIFRSKEKRQTSHYELELRHFETAEDDQTNSDADLFQTLMSNSIAPSHVRGTGGSSTAVESGKNGQGSEFWHIQDPTFLPTAYPLTRSDPRSFIQPRWGSLNLAAAAALLEAPLKRFDSVRNKRPNFRFGPRPPTAVRDDEQDGFSEKSQATDSRSAVEVYSPKYAFISQDGKFVEREVNHWPKRKLPELTMRYKYCEPYATNYGKKAMRRANSVGLKFTLPRTRFIYERPIFLVPRTVVNENKRRLMARHTLKDRLEPTDGYRLPSAISLQEREQSKRCCEHMALKRIKDTIEKISYDEKLKIKSDTPLSRP